MLIDYLSKYFDAKAMQADWAGFTAICLCVARITPNWSIFDRRQHAGVKKPPEGG
jgi:hypothetical protein